MPKKKVKPKQLKQLKTRAALDIKFLWTISLLHISRAEYEVLLQGLDTIKIIKLSEFSFFIYVPTHTWGIPKKVQKELLRLKLHNLFLLLAHGRKHKIKAMLLDIDGKVNPERFPCFEW